MPPVDKHICAVGRGICYLKAHIVIRIDKNPPAHYLVFYAEADGSAEPARRHSKKPHCHRIGNGYFHSLERFATCREKSRVFIAVIGGKICADGHAEIGRSHLANERTRIFHSDKRAEFIADINSAIAVAEMLCVHAEVKSA